MFPLQAGAKVSAFSSDIDNGGVSHLIKDSYVFNNLCVAPRQHRQEDITLFIGSCCCRVNDVWYKEMHYPALPAGRVEDSWGVAWTSEDTHNDTCMPAHIKATLPSSVPNKFAIFRGYSLPTWHYTIAFLKLCLALQVRETQRDSGAFFYSPTELSISAALLSFFSQPPVALPPNLQKCFCGSIAEELTLQKYLTKLLMASSWNIWQIRQSAAGWYLMQ